MKNFITGVILTTWVLSLILNYVFITGGVSREATTLAGDTECCAGDTLTAYLDRESSKIAPKTVKGRR